VSSSERAQVIQQDRFHVNRAGADRRRARQPGQRSPTLDQLFAAHRDVFRTLFSMADLDADAVGGAIARIEENRAGGMAHLAQRLAEQDVLRPDVTVDEAAHLLWLLASFNSFDQLYTGRNLPPDDAARVLITTAERSLCR
jgi:hypothetical protein